MLALQKVRGLLVGAALMCAPLAASAVPMTTGSTFTSGLVDYDIVSNVGFGTDATLQPASNGFDMTPDLTAFSFFAPSQAAGELILNATGQDFGSLVTVINDLLLQMTGTYTASAPGGYNISATLDITGSLFGTPSCTAPGCSITIADASALNAGDNWNFLADWDAADFGLTAGDEPIQVNLNVQVDLFAAGFGAADFTDAMVLSDASLVPDAVVPEPSTALLVGFGLVGAALTRRN